MFDQDVPEALQNTLGTWWPTLIRRQLGAPRRACQLQCFGILNKVYSGETAAGKAIKIQESDEVLDVHLESKIVVECRYPFPADDFVDKEDRRDRRGSEGKLHRNPLALEELSVNECSDLGW